ncbi:LOW QUALITY PROTEIN: MOXD1 homolog 1-like [Penaeus monodon]|uniref:LOW QUALITY PROTEIN: MOXD1 homolog 1-like n=1 Tax=Penaeus monodon TaxID=6687 RepID=UPI0018A7C7E0|nr:LOW QUALITY PROTEIN: MOXD1 homolog 1-like [Penaeus monodon]
MSRTHISCFGCVKEAAALSSAQVATRGYVGLGFSPNGGMKGADIVLGWVDARGHVHAHDRYATGMMIPIIDDSQDVEILGGYENDTHTVLRFARPWNTCDKEHDFQLTSDTMRVIWAYSYDDPVTEYAMTKHDQRGTKSIFLQEPQFVLPTFGDDVFTWEVRMNNVSVSGEVHTVYWCQLFKAPPLSRKVHVIGSTHRRKTRNKNPKPHMLFYDATCPRAKALENGSRSRAAVSSPHMPLSWATERGVEFPGPRLDYPCERKHGGATYFCDGKGIMIIKLSGKVALRVDALFGGLQGHRDSSGPPRVPDGELDEFPTRGYDSGHVVSPSHIIPPGREWRSVAHCDGRCVEQALPPEGVKVFRGLLHAHLLGTDITLRQIRQGRELPVVFKDMNYDFNYQQGRTLKEEMTILPGDSFITECGYDARHKQTPTFGGESTQEEMCIAFLTYYPRTDFTFCLSGSDLPSIYTSFGIQEVYGELEMTKSSRVNRPKLIDEEGENALQEKVKEKSEKNEKEKAITVDYAKIYKDVVAKAPQDLRNVSLYDLIQEPKTWQDEKLLARLQEQTAFGQHRMFCGMRGNRFFDGYPRSYKYPDFLAIKLLDEECDASHEAEAYLPVASQDEGRLCSKED